MMQLSYVTRKKLESATCYFTKGLGTTWNERPKEFVSNSLRKVLDKKSSYSCLSIQKRLQFHVWSFLIIVRPFSQCHNKVANLLTSVLLELKMY